MMDLPILGSYHTRLISACCWVREWTHRVSIRAEPITGRCLSLIPSQEDEMEKFNIIGHSVYQFPFVEVKGLNLCRCSTKDEPKYPSVIPRLKRGVR